MRIALRTVCFNIGAARACHGGEIMEEHGVLGAKLKELRKGSKLTQEQMAAYLEVEQGMITKLENGTVTMNTGLIDKCCELFGCTEEYLHGESEEYIPLNFAFRADGIRAEDLKSIAMINKIAMNLQFMDSLSGEAYYGEDR